MEVPLVMGILNATPDSFYANSRVSNLDMTLTRAGQMLADGATFLDIGGYSTRPGAPEVSEQEELDRVLPVIEAVAQAYPEALISVDTFRARVAREAAQKGAHIINDVSGGSLDEGMLETIGRLGIPYILMHMRGTPQTMASYTEYPNGLLEELISYFTEKIARLRALGVKDILLDPGFGFAKTMDQNYFLLNHLRELEMLELPLLIGLSRKGMIYKPLQVTPAEALPGTIVANTLALLNGANILRVHDVKEAAQTIQLVEKTRTA
ncbi:dihydropteroate synthase [Nibribacter ruber]|uniref:dihydropteroate synthase n=1 Tax=Nibribacter ruber TaxID=2698458 RepID=UPI00293BB00D|nr:dihydropteroate synthase [Nibribacter ruber]